MFKKNYKGERIDLQDIYNQRKILIENCQNGILPKTCEGCVELETKVWQPSLLIDNIFINNWYRCNCGCVYCIQGARGTYLQTKKGPALYKVYPLLKKLYKKKMISPELHLELIGGDLTINDESEKIINLCLKNGVSEIAFHSSCIYYSKAIEKSFKEAPYTSLDFAMDCGDRELYKKIKRIDAFDNVVENVKKYLASSPKAFEGIIAKYIIIDGLNDNIETLDKWLYLINSIGIKNVKLDVDYTKYFSECHHANPTVPEHYYKLYDHYLETVSKLGMTSYCWEFTRRVLEEGGIPKGYQ